MEDNTKFFKSKSSEYIFYLTRLEGKQRNDLLGITDECYENETEALAWYANVFQYVKNNEEAKEELSLILECIINQDYEPED